MITGTTESGFRYEIDEAVLDSWELTENLVALEEGNSGKIVPVAKELLGLKQLDRLKEFACKKDGVSHPKLSTMMTVIDEIMGGTQDTKNS